MTARGSLLLALAAALIVAPVADAKPFTIKARGSNSGMGSVRAIGDFRPARDPSLRAAMSVFGSPTKTVETGQGAGCRVNWQASGIRFLFANFGGGSACDPELGKAQNARAYDPRWRTSRRLGVGDRVRRLRRLYPGASTHGRNRWLVTGRFVFGDRSRYPLVAARVGGGRVRSFMLRITAAGD